MWNQTLFCLLPSIIQGKLPTNEWLDIICEGLDALDVNIMDKLYDNNGTEVVASVAMNCFTIESAILDSLLKNKRVYMCRVLLIKPSSVCQASHDLYKSYMLRLEKKIQAEEYKTYLISHYGHTRLIIYPK